jgi:hypothetical protein
MLKKAIILTLLLAAFNSKAQTFLEKGYFILNNNERVECLIYNPDWYKTPSKFNYKIDANSKKESHDTSTVKEFGIYDKLKFKRFNVNIDRKNLHTDDLTYNKFPESKNETLLLKEIVNGKASLFEYIDTGIVKYFILSNTGIIEQLIKIDYLTNEGLVGKNNYYKQQLFIKLKSPLIQEKDFRYLKYSKEDLIKIFSKYNNFFISNKLENSNQIKKDKKKFSSHLNLKVGYNQNSLKLSSPSIYQEFSFSGARIGAEIESIIPYFHRKWSVLFDCNYLTNFTKGIDHESQHEALDIDYDKFSFSIGLRYYHILNKNSKLFANINYAITYGSDNTSLSFSDDNYFSRRDVALHKGGVTYNTMGIGYKFKDKYSVAFEYFTPRHITDQNSYYFSEFKNFSLVIGYCLF